LRYCKITLASSRVMFEFSLRNILATIDWVVSLEKLDLVMGATPVCTPAMMWTKVGLSEILVPRTGHWYRLTWTDVWQHHRLKTVRHRGGEMNRLYQFQIKALSSLARLRLLNVLPVVRLRRLNPRRLDFILDLKSVFVTHGAGVRMSVPPGIGHRAPSDAAGARRPAKSLRVILSCLLALAAPMLIQGCAAASYGTALRRYTEVPVCCASLAELPVEPLRPGDKKSFTMGEGSPAYRFDTGKSYFRAFSLPQGPYPYKVTVKSFVIGDNLKSAYIFYPQLVTLDENRKPVRSTGPETFTLQQAGYLETMQETAGLRQKLEGGLTFTDKSRDERFLLVLTTDDLLRGKTAVSTAGDDPLLNFITVEANVAATLVQHAPAGRVSIALAPLVAGVAASGKAAQEPSPDPHPELVTVRLSGGKEIGALEPGRTTEEAARRLFEDAGAGLGQERHNSATFTIATVVLAPKRLFAPPGSSYQLYFDDKGTLVLLVDGAPANLPSSGKEFMRRFPEARESGRTLATYEVQAPLGHCVTLVAAFRAAGDTLESAAYGYGCPVK
jgi:hypothetical protein